MNLRPTQLADIPFILAAESHIDNASYVTQCSKAWHEMAIASADYAHFVVERTADSDRTANNQTNSHQTDTATALGYTILAGIQSPHRSLEIRRIVVLEKGQGHGRKILRWIKAFTFEQLGHHRLWLDVLESNRRAKHLYESEGFVTEGVIREGFKTKTGYESMILMSILESEYS